ncbi:hypothetical protein VTN00DRAFT_5355 [Thermoascus crustaceus]|uniref:uncharacterized protein n=1 Tax=Thermoascus crustaceus TaxID=5088 RepID=UPI003744983F
MTEEQDLLAKIGQLAGQINRHKNQASQNQRPYHSGPPTSPYSSRHAPYRHPSGWAPYRGRPSARRPVAPHRNRTLILNNARTSTPDGQSTASPVASDNDGEAKPGSSSGWVAKRDRHMQLINSAVYDKEMQARTKAIEESRRQKAERRAKIEEAKVLRYAQGAGRQYQSVPAHAPAAAQRPAAYQIMVNDITFQVARGGSKLIRLSNDPNTAKATPKRVTVGGVSFVRSKSGNLHRLGAVASRRKATGVKKKNELCKRFSTTGTCYKGPSCPYIHDPDKVAICKEFLQTGKCSAGLGCDLSHEPSPHRSPACMHFLRGRCSNPECRYAHIRVTPGAPVCRAFATLGYCERGAECDERHVHECPDYANTGTCNRKRCKLPHVDRAGQIRKNAAANKAGSPEEDDEEADLSSEEEDFDAIDSDDVDSDELDEDPVEMIEAGPDTGEISQQQDFVRF